MPHINRMKFTRIPKSNLRINSYVTGHQVKCSQSAILFILVSRKSTNWRLLPAAIITASLAISGCSIPETVSSAAAPPAAPEVSIIAVSTENTAIYSDYAAQTFARDMVEVRGRVVESVRGPEARAHIDTLSRKYRGRDYDPSIIKSERVILRIAPETLHEH